MAVASLVNEPFRIWLSSALSYVGGATYNWVTIQWMNLAVLASTNGTYFLVYTLSILVVGGLFFGLAVRWIWARRPHWGSVTPKVPQTGLGAMQREPAEPEPARTTKTVVKVPVPAQETTVAPEEQVKEAEA